MKLANYFDYNTGIDIILWRGEKRWGEVLETVAIQWRGLTVSLNIAIVSGIVNERGSGYVADLRLLTCFRSHETLRSFKCTSCKIYRPNHEISQIFDSTKSLETATAILQKENESLTHCRLNEQHDPVTASALPDRLWSLAYAAR